jgi:hypothetical protein
MSGFSGTLSSCDLLMLDPPIYFATDLGFLSVGSQEVGGIGIIQSLAVI